jgi:hypothetical protein
MPANASWLGAPWNASVGAKMRSFRSVTAIPCGGSPSLHAPSATAASVFDVAVEAQLSNLFDLSSIMDTISLDISDSSSDIDQKNTQLDI